MTLNKIIEWIVYSSKDPKKVSLSIKMLGLASIPYFIQAMGLSCSFGFVCITADVTALEVLVTEIANSVLLFLILFGHLGAVFAILRKIILTATGKNKVLR